MLPIALRARGTLSRRLPSMLLLGLVAGPFSSAVAEPFVTQLEWIHPDPASVAHFEVLFAFSPEEQLSPAVVDVGLPISGDHFVWGLTVDDQTSLWVAVVAVGPDGERSSRSAWRRIDWRPGQGPLDPPGRPYLVDESHS